MLQRVLLEGRQEYDTYGYVDVSDEDIVYTEQEKPDPINPIAREHVARWIFEETSEGDYDLRRYMGQVKAKLAQLLDVMPNGYEPNLSDGTDEYVNPPSEIVDLLADDGKIYSVDVAHVPTELSDWLVTDPNADVLRTYFEATDRKFGYHLAARGAVSFTDWLEREGKDQDPYVLAAPAA